MHRKPTTKSHIAEEEEEEERRANKTEAKKWSSDLKQWNDDVCYFSCYDSKRKVQADVVGEASNLKVWSCSLSDATKKRERELWVSEERELWVKEKKNEEGEDTEKNQERDVTWWDKSYEWVPFFA